jgi:tetratricopeptide (TPR) repeat protein
MNVLLPILVTLLLAGGDEDADRFRKAFDRAGALQAKNDVQAARDAWREAHGLVRSVCGEDSEEEARILYGLGRCLPPFGQAKEAVVHLRRALPIAERRTGRDSKLTYDVLRQLSMLLVGAGEYREALPHARRALTLAERYEKAGMEPLADVRLRLARAELECGRPWTAERLYRKALRGPRNAHAWVGIGRVRMALGRYDEAEMYLRKAFELAGRGLLRACEGWLLADAIEKRGREAEAEALRRELASVWRQVG